MKLSRSSFRTVRGNERPASAIRKRRTNRGTLRCLDRNDHQISLSGCGRINESCPVFLSPASVIGYGAQVWFAANCARSGAGPFLVPLAFDHHHPCQAWRQTGSASPVVLPGRRAVSSSCHPQFRARSYSILQHIRCRTFHRYPQILRKNALLPLADDQFKPRSILPLCTAFIASRRWP